MRFIIIALMAFAMGCLPALERPTASPQLPGVDTIAEAQVENVYGSVGGYFGGLGDFNEDAYSSSYTESEWSSTYNLYANVGDEVVMARLFIYDGRSISDFDDGIYVFTEDDNGMVGGVGCSGPEEGRWSTDYVSAETTLVVYPTDSGRAVDYEFLFKDISGEVDSALSGTMFFD